MEMSDVAGISRQREGQISNRETVGVERAHYNQVILLNGLICYT